MWFRCAAASVICHICCGSFEIARQDKLNSAMGDMNKGGIIRLVVVVWYEILGSVVKRGKKKEGRKGENEQSRVLSRNRNRELD